MSRDLIQNLLKTTAQFDYPCHSRIHRLNSFDHVNTNCYIKREDELSCGISGSKIRKYRTLLPYLIQQNFKEILVIGSAYSNHVLGIAQIFNENKISATFFLKGHYTRSNQGNALLSTLLIPAEKIVWLSANEWKNVETIVQDYAQMQPHTTYILPEGGEGAVSFIGALTLIIDIEKNEKEHDLKFDHIFVDSGTALTANALILGAKLLKKTALIHVVSMAEDETVFYAKNLTYQNLLRNLLHTKLNLDVKNFKLYRPSLKKFGQINQEIFHFITNFARSEGVLTDPIYSAKLFFEAKRIIKEQNLTGNILIIHSGGTLTLGGFSEAMLKSREFFKL